MIYLIYEIDTGEIIGHGDKLVVDGNIIVCGVRLIGFKSDKISLGSCDEWVEGAINISELGEITLIDIGDTEADYDQWDIKQKIMLKVLVKEINTLRAEHGLPARTKSQVVQALKNELSG